MAYSEDLVHRVKLLLAHRTDVVEKKMFGKWCFMVDDKMCINVGEDQLMLRLNPEDHEELVHIEGCETVHMRGREAKGFYYIADFAFESDAALQKWVDRALAYNIIAPISKKRKKK